MCALSEELADCSTTYKLVPQPISLEKCTSWNEGFMLEGAWDDFDPQWICAFRVKVENARLFEISDELGRLWRMQRSAPGRR